MNIIETEELKFPKETYDALDVYKLEQVRGHLVDVMVKYKGGDKALESLLSAALSASYNLRIAIEESLV